MITVLPGQPESRLQGLSSGFWNNRHYNAYISGNAFTILEEAHTLVQTIYDDNADNLLVAIALNENSGTIATCSAREIRLYQPLERGHNEVKVVHHPFHVIFMQLIHLQWSLQACFGNPNPSPRTAPSLSWGCTEELLVASTHLSLFSTRKQPVCFWEMKLPSPARLALVSHDSSYIVCVGYFDQLPKVWRRLTYGYDEVRFDVTYLEHPDLVISARWRKLHRTGNTFDNVLYTLCQDNIVRIWIPTDTSDGRHWQVWGSVSLISPGLTKELPGTSRLVCFIDGCSLMSPVKQVEVHPVADHQKSGHDSKNHVVAVVHQTTSDICLSIDRRGRLSAWVFENLGCGDNGSPRALNVAQLSSREFETLGGFLQTNGFPHIQIQCFYTACDETLHFLFHDFDGRIGIFKSKIADLLNPVADGRRLSLQALWTGHSAPIRKIIRNYSGRAVMSRTSNGECILWQHSSRSSNTKDLPLRRRSFTSLGKSVRFICILQQGDLAAFLCDDAIDLWDCRHNTTSRLAGLPMNVSGKPLCLIKLPRSEPGDFKAAHVATITSDRQGVVWEINLSQRPDDTRQSCKAVIRQFCRFNLGIAEDLKHVLPVDPAGSLPILSSFLDIFARDVAISYTHTGRVDFWTARLDPARRGVDWLSTCSTETGISDPALASGSVLKKAALVDSTRSEITIWDIGSSRLEFQQDYNANAIQDLDWTSTPDGQSILAVGFQHRVVLLSQMRFDYLNQGPAWAPIRELSIRHLTPYPIGDSTWLGDGHLIVGAGNQLFVFDRRSGSGESLMADVRLAHRQDGTWDLFEAVRKFNGPLPVFHPQFLSQCVLAGKATLVRQILAALNKILKYLVPGESVDDYLGLDIEKFYTACATQTRTSQRAMGHLREGLSDEDDEEFSAHTASSINEKLLRVGIPQLSGHEQIQLADMVECVTVVERHRRSLDENGARFILFCRQNALRKGRTSEMQLSWREINWAFHSNSQELLVDFVSRQAHGSMLWEHARESGMFMWLSDLNAVKLQFEAIARNIYTEPEVKDPVGCSLFYLALRKKGVLQGLWRTASWNKEQAATRRLLANNFEDSRWRTAALKNAYALLSKRRFEYAAAFFLLADQLEDAVEVCLRQLRDMQLGIAIIRVFEGDGGPVLRKVLGEEVLPMAAQQGNRWLASWAFWMLGRKDMAVRALIMPVHSLLETPCSPNLRSRFFLTDDPALVVLYSQLRQQTLQTLRGASKVTPKLEWEFVLHSAKLYDRMGCDLLGLDLVRNWEFQRQAAAGFGGDVNPLKILRRRSSLIVDDMPAVNWGIAAPTGRDDTRPPPATLSPSFQEPDAASLLDSFGL
ncbi:hypothetical protein L249_6050 [Ophiocordyceps polyrhachis-furcata BCC 54312]|uniref:RAVE complex protein Rav1 C-terminal domain-containing protein n=1 Tax=Ophiocordyceps polyrhachis-furcata BCC 54312 TaxID=1330021 RepID=A0A367LID2_9HYPO|nr:hypothetical protein L249_6050 [Ophiocordyceps polyrhachis-furcata BCC 54312]